MNAYDDRDRTAFGEEVRRIIGPTDRSTRALPYLILFLVAFTAASSWCRRYVARTREAPVMRRLDRLETAVRAAGIPLSDPPRTGGPREDPDHAEPVVLPADRVRDRP